MTCDQYWESNESTDDALRKRAEQHFAECERCQAEHRKLQSSLSRLSQHEPLDARQRRLWLQAAAPSAVLARPISRESGRATSTSRAGMRGAIAAVCTAALMTLIAVAIHSSTRKPDLPGTKESTGIIASTQSPVTVIPLTWALCLGQIEQDLAATDARLQQVSEAVSLVELQRDVDQTLEQFRHWND